MDKNFKLPNGVIIDKGTNQTSLDFSVADDIEKEKIEKDEIIKKYKIPDSQLDLLNKRKNEWFMGKKETVDEWHGRMIEEEHADHISSSGGYRR